MTPHRLVASASNPLLALRADVEAFTMEQLHLSDIAHGRSGDKGNHANIAILAYTSKGFAWLREHLTAERVHEYFRSLDPARVVRYEAPNLLALNFVLYEVLAGGASRSLRIDTQGKTLALSLLRMPLPPIEDMQSMLRPKARVPHER